MRKLSWVCAKKFFVTSTIDIRADTKIGLSLNPLLELDLASLR